MTTEAMILDILNKAREARNKLYKIETAALALTKAALSHAPTEAMAQLKSRLDYRLNDALCEMEPEHDDSIHGFNEAWDIMRGLFNEAPAGEVTLAVLDDMDNERSQSAGWRTMESAPKDKTWILLRGRNAANRPMVPVVAAWRPFGASSDCGWVDSGSFKPVDNLAIEWHALP